MKPTLLPGALLAFATATSVHAQAIKHADVKSLRDRGVTILMIEQTARSALEISDFGVVRELGQTRTNDKAERILNDPRIGQLLLGGAMEATAA